MTWNTAKKRNLSERAKLLLWIVYLETERDWGTGEIKRFFVPKSGAYYFTLHGRHDSTFISGAGDARVLESLKARGLVERPKTSLSGRYIYVLTEAGLAVATSMIDSDEFIEG